jgi:(1->4)-alpha-D-glucan 1-alpha-D-glucosylmutase
VEEFHRAMLAAHEAWPLAMLALSTHDTKRSADLRARLALISEDPDGWNAAAARLTAAAAPHRAGPELPTPSDAYLFFQVLVGAWPIDGERAAAYMEKASRSASLHTSWTAPDAAYDGALAAFVRGCLADPAFVEVVEATVEPLVEPGWRAALVQVALQLTATGVPDLYQGSELWDLTLVDPDNRRSVDYDLRRRLLDETRPLTAAQAWERRDEGIAKLWLIGRALDIRSRRPMALGRAGAYRPLGAEGQRSDAVVAFARGDEVVTVVPRLIRRIGRLGWGDTTLELPPGRWHALDGTAHEGTRRVDGLLDAFPVAILERSA